MKEARVAERQDLGWWILGVGVAEATSSIVQELEDRSRGSE